MKLALSGKMGSGKDFLASHIISKYKWDKEKFRRFAFADGLKCMVEDNFDVKKGEHENAREILQIYGKIGRLADPLFWVKPVLEDAELFKGHVIVTDLRFKNEADELRRNGFTLIRINCQEVVRKHRTKLDNPNDISETDLDNYDFDLYFDGKEEEYEERVKTLMYLIIELDNRTKLEEIK